VRDILVKDKNIKNLIFDTTGVGYFEIGKTAPVVDDLNTALTKQRAGTGVKVSSLAEVELPKAEVVYEIAVSGLG
jgi:hypothetical protein